MSPLRPLSVPLGPAVAAGLVVLTVGCAHHRPTPTEAPTPVAAAAPTPSSPTPVTPVSNNPSARVNSEQMRQTLAQMTFFDFDRSLLTDQDRATLDAKIPILLDNPSLRIRVDGSCDDRGSDEYNMALGQRRAAAAKRYLTDHGVDASRIDIISYGKERPIAQGNDEAAWARNRNDQFEIVAGGDQLRAGQ